MIAPPKQKEDCRKLWRKVVEVTDATNSLMNVTGLMDGRVRGIGTFQMRGGESLLKFFVQLREGETGNFPGGGGGGGGTEPDSTVTTVVSSLNPSGFGVAVHFTATVSPSVATGTIQFLIDGVNFGSPVALSSGVAVSGNTTTIAVGDHQIDAIYSGDTDYLPSTGSMTQTVQAVGTTVDVTPSKNPSTQGESVRWFADVTPSNATGTIQFKIDGVNFGPAVILVGGSATSNFTSSLSNGNHTISAVYSGDASHSGATGTFTQTVQAYPTAFTITGPSPIQLQAAWTYTLTSGTYTGVVRLYCDGDLDFQSLPFATIFHFGGGIAWSGVPNIAINGNTVVPLGATSGPRRFIDISMTSGTGTFQLRADGGAFVNYGTGDFATGTFSLAVGNPFNSTDRPTLNGSGSVTGNFQ